MLEQFELFGVAFRFAAIGILAFVSIILVRDAGQIWAGRLTAMFTLSVCGYLLCSLDSIREVLGAWLPLLHMICVATPFLLWLSARAIFVDGFRPCAVHWLALVAFDLLGVGILYIQDPPELAVVLGLLNGGARIGLLGHAIWSAWRGRNDDLVEARREMRGRFVLVAAALSLIVVSIELAVTHIPAPPEFETLAAIGILLITVMVSPSVVRLELGQIFPPMGAQGPAPKGKAGSERAALGAIQRSMEVERIFQNPGLSIASFAAHVHLPEYRLRRIINEHLGFRNFNAFVNHYRIASIKEVLADHRQSRLPILTIAMDAGFASIAPFNKAFKELVGEVPSVFRARMLADQDSTIGMGED